MYKVIHVKKRDGKNEIFNEKKIHDAIKKAFVENDNYTESAVDKLTNEVSRNISEDMTVENIQDLVEEILIKNNYAKIAKSYILYREKQKNKRDDSRIGIKTIEGEYIDKEIILAQIKNLSFDLKIDENMLVKETISTLHEGISKSDVEKAILNSIKTHIDNHYDYSSLGSRFMLNEMSEKILHEDITNHSLEYKKQFENYLQRGVELELLDKRLLNFDIDTLAKAIDEKRDLLFHYLGMQTIYDRYLIRDRKQNIIELPQWFFMRVAMGLSLKEENKEEWTIKFYNTLSEMNAVSSTPTLFNSGTTHSQMSSCYVNSVQDSLDNIFKTYSDCAKLSKWAGGIGTDWTQVRGSGANIKGTNGESQGIIPFLKIFNDVALAVNQGGKRKGAMAAYLEPWHIDIEEFLDLKKNTGDERRRTHDIHTAVFIPDLLMKRVKENGTWTLVSPEDAPELYNTYGKEFEQKYAIVEKSGIGKTIQANDLWKKILTRLYETGHPWLTFKDAINVRNPQSHKGMIHSSNLCTEIALNTNKHETAVCNLASINLSNMVVNGGLDRDLMAKTVETAMRMLDNVIELNFYPTTEAKNSNLQHRPVGLGVMGYQDALYKLKIDFDSDENVSFSDESMELISYHAILTSSKLAKEKGKYESYEGSKWSKGIFPIDTLDILESTRGEKIKVNRNSNLDWTNVRSHVNEYGMRNSCCMAIAPTATIANIVGTTPCIEPTYKNLYMKENLSGNFVLINRHLVDELEAVGLWNKEILTKIKINNGSILAIDEIPSEIRRRFKETFEIHHNWVIDCAARRSKWIDQAASTNIFLKTTSGKVISDLYMDAWEKGIKTTYYLRTLAASQVTKTVGTGDGISSKTGVEETKQEVKVCAIDDPDCEACQ